MNLYQIREAIRTETDEAKVSELIAQRDRMVAEESANRQPVSSSEWNARMLDATHG